MLRPAYLLSIAFVNLLKQNKKQPRENNKNYGQPCASNKQCLLLQKGTDLGKNGNNELRVAQTAVAYLCAQLVHHVYCLPSSETCI